MEYRAVGQEDRERRSKGIALGWRKTSPAAFDVFSHPRCVKKRWSTVRPTRNLDDSGTNLPDGGFTRQEPCLNILV